MKRLVFALLLITGVACSQKKESTSKLFLSGEKLAQLTNNKLEEVSGLAASATNPGYLWTHNDSEREPSIYLIDEKLQIQLTCTLQGVGNRDWEDIAVGPCPDPNKNYVYVAEIGDNLAKYQYKFIYRFEEPVLRDDSSEISITQFDRIVFQLPDKRKDTEALMIDPKTKDLYIISKREQPVYLYSLPYPHSLSDTITAREVMSLPFTQIVAADISANGKEILMKSYKEVYYWSNSSGKKVPEVLSEKPVNVPYEEEPQGESIAWKLDGSGFYTISEKNPGKDSFLFFYKRK